LATIDKTTKIKTQPKILALYQETVSEMQLFNIGSQIKAIIREKVGLQGTRASYTKFVQQWHISVCGVPG